MGLLEAIIDEGLYRPSDVRFGSKADICSAITDVRFVPESRHHDGRK